MATVPLTVLLFEFFLISIKESQGLTQSFTGVVASAYTPFFENGLINFDLIPTLAQRYKDYCIENIILVANAGEGPSLNLTDKEAVVSKWIEVGKGFKFIVDVGGLPLYDSVELVKFCYELKVTGILVSPVVSYKGTLDEIMHDLQLISDAAPYLQLFYYDDYRFSASLGVPAGEIVSVASKRICNLAGIVTTMDTALMLKATQSLNDLTVMIIGHDQIAATFETKFNASIDTSANLFPKTMLSIYTASRNCNCEEVEAQQARLSRLIAAINNLNHTVIDVTSRDYIPNQKEAYRLIWGTDLGIRIPLVKPTPATTRQIAANLLKLGVELKGYP